MACHNEEEDANKQEMMERSKQALSDRILIVLGSGPPVERLAMRRLSAGGRLAVIETKGVAGMTRVKLPSGEMPDVWDPPAQQPGRRSALAQRLNAHRQQDLFKRGPIVVEAEDAWELQVLTWEGVDVGVRAALGGKALWEICGAVVVNPSEADAESQDVDVQDLEAMPMFYVPRSRIAMAMAVEAGCVLIAALASIWIEGSASTGQWPWWRVLFLAPHNFMITLPFACPLWALAFTGILPPFHYNLGVACICGSVCALVATLGGSSYISAMIGFLPAIWCTQVWYFLTRHRAPLRRWAAQLLFGLVFVGLTSGVACCYYLIAVVYMGMVASDVFWLLPMLFLPAATSTIEVSAVTAMTVIYERLVVARRAKRPGCVHGDQRVQLTVVVGLAHGCAEATRFASLITETVTYDKSYAWVGTLALCLMSNLMQRKGWVDWLTGFLWRRISSQPTMGGALKVIHAQVKNSCGYPRFTMIISFGVARLSVYQQLDPSHPQFPLFNRTTALACVLLPLFEIIEDLLTLFVFPSPPLSDWDISAYSGLGPYDLRQLLAFSSMTVDGVRTRGVSTMEGKATSQRQPHCSLSMNGARMMSIGCTLGLLCGISTQTIYMMELLIGPGYLRGVCPHPLPDMLEAIKQGFVVDVPYFCG